MQTLAKTNCLNKFFQHKLTKIKFINKAYFHSWDANPVECFQILRIRTVNKIY